MASILLWLLSSGAAAAEAPPCARVFTSDDVEEVLDFTSSAWSALDIEHFAASTEMLRQVVACTEVPLSGRQAADILRWQALGAFMNRDDAAARQWFASARLVDPSYRFPTSVVPRGNPVHTLYEDSADLSAAFTVLRPPATGTVQINGRLSLQRPDDWPVIVQLVGDDGALSYTGLLYPGDATPAYELAPEGVNLGVNYESRPVPIHVPLYVGAAATGATAVLLWGGGLAARARFRSNDPAPDFHELSGLRARANVLSGASLSCLAVSGALAVTGHMSRRW